MFVVERLLCAADGNQAACTTSCIRNASSWSVAQARPTIFPCTDLLISAQITGYSAPGVEKVVQHLYDEDEIAKNRAKAPDVKESYECGREDDPAMPNIWLPQGVLPGFREACLEFYWVSFYAADYPKRDRSVTISSFRG